jgi:hypothetical protein
LKSPVNKKLLRFAALQIIKTSASWDTKMGKLK